MSACVILLSLGNHEFDENVDGLVPFIRNLSAPVLAANLILDKVPEMKDIKNLYNSLIIVKDGVKIGIIGYLTPDTKQLAQKNEVEYEEEIISLRREVKLMKEQNVTIIIALGHSGYEKDLVIAREVEDLDLVIGGHSHTLLSNDHMTSENDTITGPYPTNVKQANGRIVRVVQAFVYTKYMGKLHLIFDAQGEIIKCEGNPILIDNNIPEDPKVLEIVEKYKTEADKRSSYDEVVGSSLVYLNGDCRLRECNMGNLIADAMLNYTLQVYGDKYPEPNIAFIQGGRIRASISHTKKPMALTMTDIVTVLPYKDPLTIVTMNGTILKQSLEHSVSKWSTIDSKGQFYQFSGMKVTYDLAKPVGSRVVMAEAVCSNCDKKLTAIKDYYEYEMIIPSFIVDGGDGYNMFSDLPTITVDYNEVTCLLYYLGKYSPVNPRLDGRITVLNENKINDGIVANAFSMGYKFESLGNHEFDNGVSGLTPFIKNLTCPVLAANLVLNKVPELAEEHNLMNSVVLDVAGVEIGIIGYLTPETKFLAVPNKVDYIDEIIALKKEVKKLQDKGIKIIIALGHSGILKDSQIAKEVEGLDLVIGGHTNTFLWNGTSPDSEEPQGAYPTYVTQASGRLVPVVQAYAYTKYLGRLDMVFDANGELIKAEGMPILLDKNIPQDPEVQAIINRYTADVSNITDEVVGYTSVVLDGDTCKRYECNLGNMITDAMVFRYAVDYKGEHWTDAPIAIVAGGGIRTSIAHTVMPVNITKGELLEVMPFDGNMVTVTMNGSVLLKALEHSVENYDALEAPGAFLQYSGIKITYDLKAPPGSRVVKAEARCWACSIPKFSEIKHKELYKVLMPSFVAIGGDGFSFNDLPTQSLNYNELMSTQYYLSRHSPVYPQVEGRITLLQNLNAKTYSSSSTIVLSLVPAMVTLCNILAQFCNNK